jgi:hypothetical protein
LANREIILPGQCYNRVLESIEEGNYFDFLADLEQKLRLEHVSQHVISLAMARGRLVQDLSDFADQEVAMLTGCTFSFFLPLSSHRSSCTDGAGRFCSNVHPLPWQFHFHQGDGVHDALLRPLLP